jgi:ubiquinone/menaquinone biosynthesis C-methylase UbiE
MQTRIFKSLPANDDYFRFKIADIVDRHLAKFKEYSGKPVETIKYFEFGAGWDLIIPITLSLVGVRDIYICDIKKLVFPELVINTIKRLKAMEAEMSFHYSIDLAEINENILNRENLIDYLKEWFGINYLAPMDAAATKFEDNYFDLIATTAVLEHVPKDAIQRIFKECNRIISPDGIFSNLIDYKDHYAYFDTQTSVYNFLTFSDKKWSKFNSSLHYQNRLRHSEYLEALKNAGFNLIFERLQTPTDSELQQYKELILDEKFLHFEEKDLLVQSSHVISRKK